MFSSIDFAYAEQFIISFFSYLFFSLYNKTSDFVEQTSVRHDWCASYIIILHLMMMTDYIYLSTYEASYFFP